MAVQLFRNSTKSQAGRISSNTFQSVLQLIKDLLNALPNMFTNTRETHSALGPALQAAFKLMSPTGGRISVFQTQLPSLGAGLLHSREDPNQRSSTKVKNFPYYSFQKTKDWLCLSDLHSSADRLLGLHL